MRGLVLLHEEPHGIDKLLHDQSAKLLPAGVLGFSDTEIGDHRGTTEP